MVHKSYLENYFSPLKGKFLYLCFTLYRSEAESSFPTAAQDSVSKLVIYPHHLHCSLSLT